MKTKSQKQIVNVTRRKNALKEKLDNIDARIEKKVFDGYYESRLAIKMSMWQKGKVIDVFFRGVKTTISYYQLEKETSRNRANLKQWHNLYRKCPKLNDYREVAEREAYDWTEKALDKYNARLALPNGTADTEEPKLPETSKAYVSICRACSKLHDALQQYWQEFVSSDSPFSYTDELEKLRKLLSRIRHAQKSVSHSNSG